MIRIAFIALLLLQKACTSVDTADIPAHLSNVTHLTVYPENIQPIFEMQLIREQHFGSTDEQLIGQMVSVPAVDEQGRVFIADSDRLTIHVFDFDGRHLAQLGREGRGPGEFNGFSLDPLRLTSTRFYVEDPRLQRVTIYSLASLDYVGEVKLDKRLLWGDKEELQRSNPHLFWVHQDSTFLMQFHDAYSLIATRPGVNIPVRNASSDILNRYFLMDLKGQIISDQIFEELLPESFGLGGVLSRKSLIGIGVDGQFFSARSNEFLIKVHDHLGRYRNAFFYPFENVPVNRETLLTRFEGDPRLMERIRGATLPDTWPALNDLLIDDENRLWISTIVEDFDIYEWWILEETGELIARFGWPRAEPIEVIRNGYAYTRQTDPETGIQQIVRYRIELEER